MRDLFTERGSIAPLGIGLFFISATLLVAISAAGSLFVFQKRLTNFAESGALFVASTDQSIEQYLEVANFDQFTSLKASDRRLPDGKTVQVTACASWVAPMDILIKFSSREICSYANARAE